MIAILKFEDDAEYWKSRLASTPKLSVSAASYVETAIVLAGTKDTPDLSVFDRFLLGSDIGIEPCNGAGRVLCA